jgi:hypothetical protein
MGEVKARSLVKDFYDVKVRGMPHGGKNEGTRPAGLNSHTEGISRHFES